MIDNIIKQYLSGHKRLVVPDLGAFIRKDSGEVVFVEYLKKDDGVLVEQIVAGYGVSENEARVVINKFISEVIAKQPSGYIIEGLGRIIKDGDGLFELFYDTSAVKTQEKLVVKAQEKSVANTPPVETVFVEKVSIPVTPNAVPPKQTVRHIPEQDNAVRQPEAGAVKKDTQEQQKSVAKDLRYQKPARPADYGKKKRTDMIMVIAIVAAIIAIGSMIFGLMANEDPIDNIRSTNPLQQEAPTTTADSLLRGQ